MAEIALRTRTMYVAKEKYTAVKPSGTVISVWTNRRIREKWMEIFCCQSRPEKRDDYTHIPNWTNICAAWSQSLFDNWMSYCRTKPKERNPNNFWKDFIEPLDFLDAMGNATESTKPKYETVIWASGNLTRNFIVYNTDATDAQLTAMAQTVEQIQNDRLFLRGTVYDYKTDISISAPTLAKIQDWNQAVYPKFDAPVVLNKFADADINNDIAQAVTNHKMNNTWNMAAWAQLRQREETSESGLTANDSGYDVVGYDNGVYFGTRYEILDKNEVNP